MKLHTSPGTAADVSPMARARGLRARSSKAAWAAGLVNPSAARQRRLIEARIFILFLPYCSRAATTMCDVTADLGDELPLRPVNRLARLVVDDLQVSDVGTGGNALRELVTAIPLDGVGLIAEVGVTRRETTVVERGLESPLKIEDAQQHLSVERG